MKDLLNNKRTVIVYALVIASFWSAIIYYSVWTNISIEKQVTITTVKNIANASFNKDQAYRQWATSHGGVYVEPTEKTPPSPWMAHIPNRDLITTDGKKLTLMNPAYMLREMMHDYSELYGIKGRIVGIVYLNKNNEADEWEANAIRSFEEGEEEIMEETSINGEQYLRLMKPMFMSQKCQKCHGHLGFENGSVRGGVSVSVPLKDYLKNELKSISSIKDTYFRIWIIGLIAIIFITVVIIISLKRKEKYLEEIIISSEVFNNTLDAIFITDHKGIILRVNKSFTQLTGYNKEEVIGKKSSILKSDYHNRNFYKHLWYTINNEGSIQIEVHNKSKNGESFVSIESISSIKNKEGKVKYFIATLHDITARKNAEERIVHMAHYDPLTNLPNRVLFQDRLTHSLDIARRDKNKVALAFIDIDGFKKVNDTKGHPMGDKLLIKVAQIIDSAIRESDTLSRLGGDEFTIIFEHIEDINNIIPICEKILSALRNEIVIDKQSIFITASIGISIFPDDGEDIHTLIQQADTAMYKAKDTGKNKFNFFEQIMTEQATKRVEIENSLISAINNKELTVYYQPKTIAKDNTLIGMEALIRWNSPTKGFIAPDHFIPIAEEMHIIDKIDLYVLDTVCKDMSDWIELGYKDIKISVNLSGFDFSTKNLYQNIIDIINKYKVKPKNIEFEITETYFVNFDQSAIGILNKLKVNGFTLSIDDFGTGYSSLSKLQKLPVDIIKIDQSFINTLDSNDENKKLVDTIINLAHILSLKAIAEGVENNEQLQYLRDKNCDFIQGYLESKPIPKEEFIEYLKTK